MNNISRIILLTVRKIILKFFLKKNSTNLDCEYDPEKVSKIIYQELTKKGSFMLARFGSTELTCLNNYFGLKNNNYLKFIKGQSPPFWWQKSIINQMQNWSGFFPANEKKIEEFCELMISDIPEVDILGSWLSLESTVKIYLKARKVHLRLIEPFWSKNPWTIALENKRVLVIHPFSREIINQYQKRELLFENKNILPKFKSFSVIKAIQSLGEADKRFNDWFEALDFMKNQIDKHNFDYCLIGAGAYGFALAAHVKRSGKKAIHLGGALQLLFGIIGKRWENPNYGVQEWGIKRGEYTSLINKHWIRPYPSSKPKFAHNVENSCYW